MLKNVGPLAAEELSCLRRLQAAGSRVAAAQGGWCVSLSLLNLPEFYPLFMFVNENIQH